MSDRDTRILEELRGHLKRAKEWAHEVNLGPPGHEGWTCIKSIREAVNDGNVGLALTRWDDLLDSPNRPRLSEEAEAYR